MNEAEQIMKRCQAGTRNHEEANNLHAACYGIIGKLLAQQEKDYERGFVDGMQKQMQSSVDKAVNRMAQPEQEPSGHFLDFAYSDSIAYVHVYDQFRKGQQFYKAPPQRKWVGLTEQQRNDIENDFEVFISIHVFDAIEAKLKQKNGYAEEKNT